MTEIRHLTREEQLKWRIRFLQDQKKALEEYLKDTEEELEKVKKKEGSK